MRLAIAAALVLAASACGNLEGPRTGSISPPTDVLTRWNDFPSDQVPRPIVLFETDWPGQSFNTGSNIEPLCGDFMPGFQLPSEKPGQSSVIWPGGAPVGYPASSAAEAFMAMKGMSRTTGVICSARVPLRVTAAHLGIATFATDRGKAQMSAWLFTATGVQADFAYPAIATSSIWAGGLAQTSLASAASVSADGRALTFDFVGGPFDGPCAQSYRGVVAESSHAVSIAVQSSPGRVEAGPNACYSQTAIRSVTLQLGSALGGRVVVDASGGVVGVSTPPAI